MIELLALGIAVAVGWYWIDTLNAREAALAAAQRACEAEGCSVTLLGRDVLTVRLARPSMPPVAGNVIDLRDLRE